MRFDDMVDCFRTLSKHDFIFFSLSDYFHALRSIR